MVPTERFSDRAHDYDRYRPGYAVGAVERVREFGELGRGGIVADIGSGTGILAEALLKSGANVIGVEPNDAMRSIAEVKLTQWPGFRSVKATAESTELASQSVDLVTAGQAFHWFEPDLARTEWRRILRGAGRVALLWNERIVATDEASAEYDARMRVHSSVDLTAVHHFDHGEQKIRELFGSQEIMGERFPNRQRLDREHFIGRARSASYCPKTEEGLEWLASYFERHSREGWLEVELETVVYCGCLA